MARTPTSKRLPFRSRVLLGLAWVGWALASLTVCKTAAKAVAVRVCPGPPPQISFWRGLRRVVCIRNLVPGTGFSCFQGPRCRAPRRLQKGGKEAEKTAETVGFFENRCHAISGSRGGFGAPSPTAASSRAEGLGELGMSAGRASSRAAYSAPNQNLQGARRP